MRRATVFPQMPLPSGKSATVGSLKYGYLHFARAFLLALGFLFHAAWLCTDGNDVFKSGMDVIHGFRMEGFFVIAGLLSAHSLRRVPSSRFLLRRTERLGIPLLFFSLIFGISKPDPTLGLRSLDSVCPDPFRGPTMSLGWILQVIYGS